MNTFGNCPARNFQVRVESCPTSRRRRRLFNGPVAPLTFSICISSIPVLEETAQHLIQATPTRISDNIRGAHWLKLITNLNNALPALIDGTFHQVYADPFLASLAIRIMREGLNASRKAGTRLESLPEVSVGLTRLINFLPVKLAARVASARVERMKTPWPLLGSTLQSLRRKRSTEIDYLNGEVVELGKKTGTSTPLNARIVELVHQVEQTGTFFTVDEVRRKFLYLERVGKDSPSLDRRGWVKFES